jgi:acyl-CoA reductase-like NAD-dependent aldehyde dehydrogenase
LCGKGQICLAAKRVYAHSSIYEELRGELARLAGEAVVDDGLKHGASIGPIQNKTQYEKVKGFLEDARTNGNVIAGGQAMEQKGYLNAPTIMRDIGDDARLVCEEQFGPILPVMSFEDVEDAIARTNDTDYGLGGSVWTGDVARGIAVASKVQSGTVWVNKWLDMPFDVPFRGAKHSGIGAENGQEGIEEYTQARIINVAL